jgi:AraC family transcriptional regulator of adaptative response / DNA-3-methyladenine glycosylase II
MTLHDDAAYRAISTHDARFDGRLFVGVTTTRVYCRPVCRVRLPRRENCRFFSNAALAEANGFRPCLRCRPELAPGLSLMDSSQALAQQAARTIEQAAHDGSALSMPRLASRMGVTDRHLRRIFQQHVGVAPIDYLTTQRLLLAKHLLTDTTMPVTQVALASGFASLRRFNAAFSERYRMNPSGLRRARVDGDDEAQRAASTTLRLRLAYRPPYQHDAMLRFFAARALDGIEAVDAQGMRRTVALPYRGRMLGGWMAWRFVPLRHEVEAVAQVQRRDRAHWCSAHGRPDLDADPTASTLCWPPCPFDARPASACPAVRRLRNRRSRRARPAGHGEGPRTLTMRLVERFGVPLSTPFADLQWLFPQAEAIAGADPDAIGSLGIVRQRVGALQALARARVRRLARTASRRTAAGHPATSAALPGVGEWTAQVIAMRVLAWPDAFPASDIGVLNALGTRDVAAAAAQAQAWQPWRSYAVMRLWQSLET